MDYLGGAVAAACVCAFGTLVGYDRDRAYYPMVLALLTMVSTAVAAADTSLGSVARDLGVFAAFLAVAVLGYRTSLWLVIAGFLAHAAIATARASALIDVGGPAWWTASSFSFDLVVGVYLGWKLQAGSIRPRPWARSSVTAGGSRGERIAGAEGAVPMSITTLPKDDEIASLVPTPDSIVWRRASDIRLFMSSGYALLMQVSHPTVGAGVRDHSVYAKDPGGRLIRTLDYVNALIYGGEAESARMGRQLRELHKRIQGTTPEGKRYHSLEPGAFAWVHATLLQGTVDAHARFGRPMDPDQLARFYVGYKRLGRLVGVRDKDLPDTWEGFCVYFDEMVETRLENNDAVQDLLYNMRRPIPPLPWIPDAGWRVARRPMTHILNLGATGMLPPVLRERFGLTWTTAQENELRVLSAALRAATPLMPEPLRVSGPQYLKLRRAMNERFSRAIVRA